MRFSATALLLIGASLINAQSCSNTCVRREVRSLSSGELDRYFSAVRQLMTSGRWDRRTASHIAVQNYAHGTSLFLVWHRAFIREVEMDLQSVDSGLCLHYWSWDMDSQAPEASTVLTDGYYGPLTDGCIGGRLVPQGWQAANPSRHCVSRSFDTSSAYNSPEQLNEIISSSTSYDTFNRRIQVPHGVVHTSFGGDMLTMASANE
jgi:tyrosinase